MADKRPAEKKHGSDAVVKRGDISKRVGVEQLRIRGVDVDRLIEMLIDAAGAEFTTYYYYTLLRMNLAGHEDYKEICEDARLEDRAHFELITPRIYELGGQLPADIRAFADRAGCPDAYLPGYSGVSQKGVEPGLATALWNLAILSPPSDGVVKALVGRADSDFVGRSRSVVETLHVFHSQRIAGLDGFWRNP